MCVELINGHRIVAFTPSGRKRVQSILLNNLRRFDDVIDEWQIWLNTDDQPEDDAWLRTLPDLWHKAKLYELPPDAPRLQPKQRNSGKFYVYTQDPDTIYFRFDDDIVFIDDRYFSNMVALRLARKEPALIYGNIQNNAICSYWQQRHGNLGCEVGVVEREYCMDAVGWGSPAFGEYVHRVLLEHAKNGTTERLFFPHRDLPMTRFSISNFCFFGETMRDGMLPQIDDEEIWLTEAYPRERGITNVLCGDALVGHYCVDEETEILARHGWLRHDELEVGDEVGGVDLKTGRGEWTRCLGVNRQPYDGPMVAVEKPSLSMWLTPNHRCVIERDTGRAGRAATQVVEARSLRPGYRIPRSAVWTDEPAEGIGERLAALCGWVAAEGWYDAGSTVRLNQSSIHTAQVAAIDALLPDAYRRESDYVWKGARRQLITWRLGADDAYAVRSVMPDKLLTPAMASLPRSEREALLEAFVAGDGHVVVMKKGTSHITIAQKVKANLDVLQMIAVTLGYKTNLSPFRDYDKWSLTITPGRAVTLRGTNGTHAPIPTKQHSGTVWCPQTETGTFIARRKGTVFVTGNSFFTQRQHLDQTDILEQYRELSERLLSAAYYRLLGAAEGSP